MTGAGADPVEAGLVESLARPGGNVTGLTNLSRELGGKRLELLKEAVPKVARVAVLYDPANPASVLEVKEVLPVAARALGLTIRSWESTSCGRFREGIRCAKQAAPGWTLRARRGPLMRANQKRIVGFALKSRLPSMYSNREAVDAGGLMYYGADHRGQLPARRILRGQNPEGSQARRSAGGAADEVRAGDQSQDGEADRRDDSAEGAGAGGSGNKVSILRSSNEVFRCKSDLSVLVAGQAHRKRDHDRSPRNVCRVKGEIRIGFGMPRNTGLSGVTMKIIFALKAPLRWLSD